MLIIMMVLTCDLNLNSAIGASANNSERDNNKPFESNAQSSVVEYYKDHEVTERQARESLRVMTEEELQTPSHCRECSDDQKRYCHSDKLLKDHCCCNQSHKKGKL